MFAPTQPQLMEPLRGADSSISNSSCNRKSTSPRGSVIARTAPPPPSGILSETFLKFIDQKHEEMHAYQG